MKKKICFVVSAPITAKAFLIKHFEYLSKEFDITLVANFETQADFEVPFVTNTKHIAIHRSINPLKDFLALIQLYFFFKKEEFFPKNILSHSIIDYFYEKNNKSF